MKKLLQNINGLIHYMPWAFVRAIIGVLAMTMMMVVWPIYCIMVSHSISPVNWSFDISRTGDQIVVYGSFVLLFAAATSVILPHDNTGGE